MKTNNFDKVMAKKVYIVITRYAMRNNNIGMVLADSLEMAMEEATNELNVEYTTQVEIFEADNAQYVFFGRRIFNKVKR